MDRDEREEMEATSGGKKKAIDKTSSGIKEGKVPGKTSKKILPSSPKFSLSPSPEGGGWVTSVMKTTLLGTLPEPKNEGKPGR